MLAWHGDCLYFFEGSTQKDYDWGLQLVENWFLLRSQIVKYSIDATNKP
jgi:hypothetical protein